MIRSTLCYIKRDKEYLMLLRNKKASDPNEGKWIGVGGKFLEGMVRDFGLEPGEGHKDNPLR